ncbi:hypothetical protein CQ020_03640 [Arthrobacter sp. MYb23]|uniref:hypothetical protein n=1 Tax=unclassified Arthrobacter TaxID=235627 RepID=UPI000CFB7DC4|nr:MULTISPECIES: hypothetical protein [unclassified Arthrobacter]PRB44313.1 hypothetical protein CQ038_03495 [Arthrobacter sp. MYb51]PRB98565.1 hypothetical protein CQ020_03640 [Arthrobacter sp. MYb23]
MTNLWVPVVAGVFVVLGAMIGALLSRTNEHRQWQRNEKLKAYQKFVETFAGAPLSNAFNIIGHDDREAAEMIAAYEEMYKVCLNAQFLAPTAIAEEINKMTIALADLQGWVNDLPTVMYAKHMSGNLSAADAKAANEAMTSEIHRELQGKLSDFATDSIKRVNVAVGLMRKDLKVQAAFPA